MKITVETAKWKKELEIKKKDLKEGLFFTAIMLVAIILATGAVLLAEKFFF